MSLTRTLGLGTRLVAQRSTLPALGVAQMQVRTAVSTTKMSQSESLDLLNRQRALRPSSPHFTIYQPQLTWIGSIANRVTGVGLSGLLYAYMVAYAVGPEAFASAHIVDIASTLPVWAKVGLKAPLAAAFSYHSFNGLRHLAWDWGYFLSLKGVYSSGYAVLAATGFATVGLCLV